jgi:hypothetical protein
MNRQLPQIGLHKKLDTTEFFLLNFGKDSDTCYLRQTDYRKRWQSDTAHHKHTAISSSFQLHYPWTSRPLIANAAMAGFAGPDLAGGIGFIGVVKDMAKLDQQLTSAKSCSNMTN